MPSKGPTHGVLPAIRQGPGLTVGAGVSGGIGTCPYMRTGTNRVPTIALKTALQRIMESS